MAWTASKVFARTITEQINGGHAFNWSTDTIKAALYASNTMTPDNTVTTDVLTEYNGTASQWVIANEVASGGGYTSGGVAVTPLSVSQTTNVVTFTSSGTPQWTSASFTAYGCLVYDSTISNIGLSYNYFGGAQTVASGTFTVTWNASGIATFTC